MTVETKIHNCECSKCQAACSFKPGWFKPGEVEKVAQHLNISVEELFKTKLMVDWYENHSVAARTVFLLSPAVVGGDVGSEFPGNPQGRCVFLEDGKCTIYPVRPFECATYIHSEKHEEVS